MTSATFRRCVALLLVLLGLQFVPSVGVADAQAACNGTTCTYRDEAMAGAKAQVETVNFCGQYGGVSHWQWTWSGKSLQAWAHCVDYPNPHGSSTWYWTAGTAQTGCSPGLTWSEEMQQCADPRCEVGRDFGIVTSGNLEQLMCLHNESDGSTCEVAGLVGADGFVHLYASGDTCNKDTYTCPSGYYKDVNGACTKKTMCPEGVPLDLETNTCAQPEVCPEGMEKGPQGICRTADNSNCPAGHVKGPDGLCIADPNMCPAGTVGTSGGGCATDADGDGEPDEANEFIDSASCDAPPICNGDDILCGHAKQLWRIDCNTRRHANVQLDEYCKVPPICERIVTFDQSRGSGCTQQEEAMMFLQWKTMCATQALVEKDQEGSETDGDANDNGQPDWTEDPGDGTQIDLGDDDADFALRSQAIVDGPEIGSSGLDTGGFGFVRTCPTIPDVEIGGRVIAFNTSKFCEWLQLGGQFVLLMAALASLRIMAGGASV